MRELGLTAEEIARRKAFLEFRDEDVERLGGLHELAQRYADGVIEDFYRHLLAFDESRRFLTDAAVPARVKAAQKQYFLRLTQGHYDGAYVDGETRVPIRQGSDIITARQQGRALAALLGFSSTDQTLIATAISELARNILLYAQSGEIILRSVQNGKKGITIIARDDGPGIADTTLALQSGYSTSNSLGLGLPGTKRIMDEFTIVSQVGKGTTITMKKWKP